MLLHIVGHRPTLSGLIRNLQGGRSGSPLFSLWCRPLGRIPMLDPKLLAKLAKLFGMASRRKPWSIDGEHADVCG